MELLRVDGPFLSGVQHHEIHLVAFGHAAQIKHALGVVVSRHGVGVVVEYRRDVRFVVAHEFGRTGGHEFDETFVGNESAVDKYLVADAVCAFQPDDAVGRVEEAEFLLFHGVGRMVGGQQIDRAVGDGCDGGLAVRFGAQRRVHFGQSAVLKQRLVVQCDVMRRGLAGDRKSFGLGFADGVEGDRGADVLEVHVHAGFAGHVNVAFDDFEFRVLRNAWNAKLAGHRTVIDRAGVVVFAMLDEVQSRLLDVFEHLFENAGGHRGTVIADGGHRMRQLVGVLMLVAMFGQVADPVGHFGGLMAGTPL